MCQLILITLAAGTVAVFSIASSPAQAQFLHCVPGHGCVQATQASYNACFSLARQRGMTVSGAGRRQLDFFIYQCLARRIPG